ncbi:hypothetical protein [Bacillus alkalicellulosilyticus]|uniref:hypothetical protein n=1 Tax=Alkalihalobacterium alkalicellulosilyticum TaxID=1912214 RepID=UPI000996CF33|nr:hypothetical protein [Bacillus alkalicellulosilyticus]
MLEFIKKYKTMTLLVAVLLVIASMTTFLLAFEKRQKLQMPPEIVVQDIYAFGEYESEIEYQQDQEGTVHQLIERQHTYLNELTGYGSIDKVKIYEIVAEDKWQNLSEDITYLIEEGVAGSKARNDLIRAHYFMQVTEQGDVNSLRYLHRIFHDLDVKINEYEGKHFNVTEAYGKRHKSLDQYLRGNGENE